MHEVFDFVRLISDSDSSVLITGESGTGKEVIANVIHRSSSRRHHPFVPVSCALFSETLIESELFGHERGAFTGATRDRPGRFELAHGGTIFLDDVDDIPLSLQVKLLRVVQNRTIERLGGLRTISVNVRILAGSKRDLKQLVSEGKFREDLFYRLNVLPIMLPALRQRPEDIPELMEHFIGLHFRKRGEKAPVISHAVRRAFMRYQWPGNIRELENACERMAQTCRCAIIREDCLSPELLVAGTPPDGEPAAPSGDSSISLDERLRRFEASLIGWALDVTGGNKSKAAALLRVKRSTLNDRIVRCGLAHAEIDAPTLVARAG
jgi:DNA-binding NtrC family response regulator